MDVESWAYIFSDISLTEFITLLQILGFNSWISLNLKKYWVFLWMEHSGPCKSGVERSFVLKFTEMVK